MTEKTFHTVSWAPSAFKEAVEHAGEAMKLSDGEYTRLSTFYLSALVDATSAVIEHNERDQVDGELAELRDHMSLPADADAATIVRHAKIAFDLSEAERPEAPGLSLSLLRKGALALLDQVDAMGKQIKALQAQLDQAHDVQITKSSGGSTAWCPICRRGVGGDDEYAIGWREGHGARIQPPQQSKKSTWKSGDIALDNTNFVHRRFEHGWRVVVRNCGVQYDDESMETALGPLLRLPSVPDEVDVVGAVPVEVAARLRADAVASASPREEGDGCG